MIDVIRIHKEYANSYGDIEVYRNQLFKELFGVPVTGNTSFTAVAVEKSPADDLIMMIPYLDELSLKIVAGELWNRGIFSYLDFHGHYDFDIDKLKKLRRIDSII